MKQIMDKMIEMARICAADQHGTRKPFWFRGEMDKTAPVFQTRFSEDPSRRNNGGAYDEYVRFVQTGQGVRMEEKSSYEDSYYEETAFWPSALDNEALCRLAEVACQRVAVELSPPDIDIKKVRRRCEDALRKTASTEDLLAVAALLGCKIE